MENLEERINNNERNKEHRLESIEHVNPGTEPGGKTFKDTDAPQLEPIEEQQRELRLEETALQRSFADHSEHQGVFAQNLVDRMRRLQEVNSTNTLTSGGGLISSDNLSIQQHEALAKVQDLTFQLLSMAERLEVLTGERNKELRCFKDQKSSDRSSYSAGSTPSSPGGTGVCGFNKIPHRYSEELSDLLSLLTKKVLELKRGLSYLCAVSDVELVPGTSDTKQVRVTSIGKKKESVTECGGPTIQCHADDISQVQEQAVDEKSENITSTFEEKADKAFRAFGKRIVHSDDPSGEETLKIDFDKSLNREKSDFKKNLKSESPSCPVANETDSVTEGNLQTIQKSTAVSIKENKKFSNGSETSNKKIKRTKRSLEKSSRVMDLSLKGRGRDKEGDIDSPQDQSPRITKKINKTVGDSLQKKSIKIRNDLQRSYSAGSAVVNESLFRGTAEKSHVEVIHPIEMNLNENCDGGLKRMDFKTDEYEGGRSFNKTPCTTLYLSPCDEIKKAEASEGTNENAAFNVFVPTTRKIFSPVRRDSKGKTSSVIGYIVNDSTKTASDETCVPAAAVKSYEDAPSESAPAGGVEMSVSDFSTDNDSKAEESSFIFPPCWILRERAQSASPALPRRHGKIRDNRAELNSEKECNSCFKNRNSPKTADRFSIEDVSSVSPSIDIEPVSSSDNKSSACKNLTPVSKKENSSPDRCNAEPFSERSNSTECKSASSSRKSRADVGFPPISPIPGRRDFKMASKDTAPSIRMMIAKYNRKVSESQELLSKSPPDNGGGGGASPIAWRSPGAERRVKAQMEKYQEEVKKVLQSSFDRRNGVAGEVKKSASAGFIRTWDRCGLQDGFNRRPSDGGGLSEKPTGFTRHGILKSSSAGSIKTTSVPSSSEAAAAAAAAKEERKTETATSKSSSVASIKCSSSVLSEPELVDSRPSISSNPVTITPVLDDDPSSSFEKPHEEPKGSPEPRTVKSESDSLLHSKYHSSRLRALRLKKAKEEFLLRGVDGGSWSMDAGGSPAATDVGAAVPVEADIGRWSSDKGRLSRISCDSDCSYQGILVDGEERRREAETRLLVKSASAGMINADSTALGDLLPQSPSDTSVPSGSGESGATSKSNRFGLSHLASRFRKVRMRKHKDKDGQSKMETVSTLCRQSLHIDWQRNRSSERKDCAVSTSKSCPSSPVLQKKEATSHWLAKTQKIFKPK